MRNRHERRRERRQIVQYEEALARLNPAKKSFGQREWQTILMLSVAECVARLQTLNSSKYHVLLDGQTITQQVIIYEVDYTPRFGVEYYTLLVKLNPVSSHQTQITITAYMPELGYLLFLLLIVMGIMLLLGFSQAEFLCLFVCSLLPLTAGSQGHLRI